MEVQLLEMKMDRVMRDQPLPWLKDLKFKIQKPDLFRYPYKNKYELISRFEINGLLENLSPYPAPCVDLESVIELDDGSNKKQYFYATTNRISALTHGESRNIHFLFVADDFLCLFDRLRDKTPCMMNFPIIRINIIYRNLSGGFFVINNVYQIIKNDKKMIL